MNLLKLTLLLPLYLLAFVVLCVFEYYVEQPEPID